jgi:hypothetical protein
MNVSRLALLGLFILVGTSALLRAEDFEKRTWRLTDEADEPRLDYGTDNVEDIPIAFSCRAGRVLVDVWINETGHGVKPDRSMTASLTAGRTTSKVRGKTLPNEEAGTQLRGHAAGQRSALCGAVEGAGSCFRGKAIPRRGPASGHWRQGASVQSFVPEAVRHCGTHRAASCPSCASGRGEKKLAGTLRSVRRTQHG